MSELSPQDVIDFWFASSSEPRWFDSTPAFDEMCRERFSKAIESAGVGRLDQWLMKPDGSLAVILLLDQMTRNVYRGSPKAFAHDAKALSVAKNMIAKGLDQDLPDERRFFVYLPFEHSEGMADQARSVTLFKELGDEMKLDYAIRHKVIIDRFGRFPHRNEVLGRKSTAEEIEFLKEPGSSF